MRMVKGGSRVLGRGGGIEMTVHVMVPSTGLWPVDATPLALPGVVWRGVTPSTIRKIEKLNRFYYPYEILRVFSFKKVP